MIYPYTCPECKKSFEVIKSVADIDIEELCICGAVAVRGIAQQQSFSKIAAADWNTKTYNPAFGKATTNLEARKLAKQKGLIEVGTENIDKIEKSFAKDREKKAEYKSPNEILSLGEIRTK